MPGRIVIAQCGVHPNGEDVVAAGDHRAERQLPAGGVANRQVDGLLQQRDIPTVTGRLQEIACHLACRPFGDTQLRLAQENIPSDRF